jgi:hypothetical protein
VITRLVSKGLDELYLGVTVRLGPDRYSCGPQSRWDRRFPLPRPTTHTFASRLAMESVDLMTIRDLMVRKTMTMTLAWKSAKTW